MFLSESNSVLFLRISLYLMQMRFSERRGEYKFTEPTPQRGYLPQINEWATRSLVRCDVERIGGDDHVPTFRAVPYCTYHHPGNLCLLLKRSRWIWGTTRMHFGGTIQEESHTIGWASSSSDRASNQRCNRVESHQYYRWSPQTKLHCEANL